MIYSFLVKSVLCLSVVLRVVTTFPMFLRPFWLWCSTFLPIYTLYTGKIFSNSFYCLSTFQINYQLQAKAGLLQIICLNSLTIISEPIHPV